MMGGDGPMTVDFALEPWLWSFDSIPRSSEGSLTTTCAHGGALLQHANAYVKSCPPTTPASK